MEAGGSSVTEPRNAGPKAPVRRGSKFSGAGKATTAVTADQTHADEGPAAPTAGEPSRPAIQLPASPPAEAAAEQESAKEAPGGAEKATRAADEGDAAKTKPSAAPEADGAPNEDTGAAGDNRTSLMHPPAAPSFSFDRLFRQRPQMDPTQFAMYTDRQTRLAKSIRNVMDMLAQRWTEYEEVVHQARQGGYPEDQILRIAVQHEVDAPPPRASQ